MNKIYKTMYDAARGCCVVASELAKKKTVVAMTCSIAVSLCATAHAVTPAGSIAETGNNVFEPSVIGTVTNNNQEFIIWGCEDYSTNESDLIIKMPTAARVEDYVNYYNAQLENINFSSNGPHDLNIQFLQDSDTAKTNYYYMASPISTAPGNEIGTLYIDSNLGGQTFNRVSEGVHIFSNLYEGEADVIEINVSGRNQTEPWETGTRTVQEGFFFSWQATDASKIKADSIQININKFQDIDWQYMNTSFGMFLLTTLSAYDYKNPENIAQDVWKDYQGAFVVNDNNAGFDSLVVGDQSYSVLGLKKASDSVHVHELNGPVLTLFDYNLRPFVLPANTTLNKVVVAPGLPAGSLLGFYGAKNFYLGGENLLNLVNNKIRLNWIQAGDGITGHLEGEFAIANSSSTSLNYNDPFATSSWDAIIAKFTAGVTEVAVDAWSTSSAIQPIDDQMFYDRQELLRQFGITGYGNATISVHTEKLIRDESSIAAEGEITGIYIENNSLYALKGEIGSSDQYFGFKEKDPNITVPSDVYRLAFGIEGEGSLFIAPEFVDDDGKTVTTEVYLGGNNSFSGGLIVGENSTLHLKNSTAAKNASFLLLEAGSSFSLDSAETLTSFKNVTIQAPALATANEDTNKAHTVTRLVGQDGSGIRLAGVDEHVSVIQGIKNSEGGSIDTPSETGELKHHVVKLENFDLELVDGAALWINHIAESANPYSPANSALLNQMAILEIGEGSHVSVAGLSGDDSSTSSHIYLGNGSIQVLNGGTLTLGEDSAIHFSQHSDGFFEVNPDRDILDPHRHASIEIAQGGTVNFDLGTNNHIYADSIIAEGHEHHLISTSWEEREGNSDPASGNIFAADRTINFSITDDALASVKNTLAVGDYDQEIISDISPVEKLFVAAEKKNIVWSDRQKLSELLATLTSEDLGEDRLTSKEFYDALGIITTVGMDNRHHAMWQTYVIRANDEGLYMTVAKTNEWEDVTNIRLSLHKSTNEAIQLTAQSQQGDLDKTSGAYNLIMKAINNFTMGESPNFLAAARMIDASGQLATVAGAQTVAFDMLQNRRDSLMRHMGSVRLPENETKLWVDVLGMQNKSFDMWNDLNGERQVKTRLSGIIMGADHQVTPDWLMGASFAYMNGTSETDLGIASQVNTDNDIDSYAFSLYSRYELNDRSRIKADLGVQRASNDIKMLMPAQSLITDALKADVDTTAVQLNARYEYSFPVTENVVLTPFAGVQLTYLQTEGYTSKLGALAAWHTDKAEQYIYSVPVGVTLDAKLVNKDAVIRPQVSVYVQPNFGDTDVENVVTGYGLSSVDRVTPEVIGDWSYGAAVGATFEFTDRFHFSVDYNFHGSNESRNNSLKASMQYAF